MSLADRIKAAAEGDAEALAEIEKLSERATYLEGELDRAIKARDKVKGDARVSTQEREELEQLRAEQAEADDAAARKAGEFEKLESKLRDQIAAAETAAAAAAQQYADKVIETAFYGATTLFGPDGLTTLTPDIALPAFRPYVEYVPGANGDGGSVVVKNRKGERIEHDGAPVPFAEAMAQVIEEWPTKAAILRTGRRAGSGARDAGSPDTSTASRAELVAMAQRGDRDALARLRETQPATQVAGLHWERRNAEQRASEK